MISDPYLRQIAGNTDKFRAVDPANESRADEISVEQMFDLSRMPETHCPHCGAELQTKQMVDKAGHAICWNMYPEPCRNPACMQKEAVLQMERDRQRAEEKAEEERRRRDEEVLAYIQASGLTVREVRTNTFEAYVPQNTSQCVALSVCRRYAEDFADRLCDEWDPEIGDGMGLYIYGANGTGKTHLAQAICGHLMKHLTGGVIYRTDAELYGEIRETLSIKEASMQGIIGLYKRCNLLVIDDVGKDKVSEWALATLYQIIDARRRYGRPVIIVSNYSPKELAQHLGTGSDSNADRAAAIMSRFEGRTDTIHVTGGDYRKAVRGASTACRAAVTRRSENGPQSGEKS